MRNTLAEFPELIKITERIFEAALKDMRAFINLSHGHLPQLTDFLNRLEVKRKLQNKKSLKSGKTEFQYDFRLPNIIEHSSIAEWRYPCPNAPFGLPACPTLKRGFLTEWVNYDRADSGNILFVETKSQETHYMIGEKKGKTIIINPNPEEKVHKKIPSLIFATNSTAVDTELQQIWDLVDKKKEGRLKGRYLLPLLMAARVDTFLNARREELLDLVHFLLEMFEVEEKEGYFSWEYFKAVAIHYSTPKLSPSSVQGINVASVMHLLGCHFLGQKRSSSVGL